MTGVQTCALPIWPDPDAAGSRSVFKTGDKGAGGVDFVVTPKGDVISTRTSEFNKNLLFMDNISGKYVGEGSSGSIRVRVENAHGPTPGYVGNADNDHLIDHIHVEHRQNGNTGAWGKGEGNKISLPQSWISK